MNQWEKKIIFKEVEVHTNRKTKKGKLLPDLVGYNNEDLMLSDYMVWVTNTHPVLDLSIFHIENEGNTGGLQGSIQGAISKGKGKKKGVLDVESIYLGIMNWLEFKLSDVSFSQEQIDFIGNLISWNCDVFIIKDREGCFSFFKYVIESVILKGIKLGGGVWTNIEQIKAKIEA